MIRFNRFINFILNALGRERVSISKKVMAGVNKAVSKINDFELIAAELAIEKKYDYVICGHIHQPQKKVVSQPRMGEESFQPGDLHGGRALFEP